MIDRFGKEVDFSELFMEETLSAKDKKNIPDDQWGLLIRDDKGEIVDRRFPLNDETHVKQAAIMFNRAKGLSDDQKRELARNIVRRAKELDMDYSGWDSLKPYLGKGKNVQESYIQESTGTVIAAVAVTGVVGALLIALSTKVLKKAITNAKANNAKRLITIKYSNESIKKLIPSTAHAYVVRSFGLLENPEWIKFNKALDSEIEVLTNALTEIANTPDKSVIKNVKSFLKTDTGIDKKFHISMDSIWEKTTFSNNGKATVQELLNSDRITDFIKNKQTKTVDNLKKIQDETTQKLSKLKDTKEHTEKVLKQQPNKKIENKCMVEIRKRCDIVFSKLTKKTEVLVKTINLITKPEFLFVFYDENGNELDKKATTARIVDEQFFPDQDSTSGTSDFDEYDIEPEDCITESFNEIFGPVIREAFDAVTGEEIPINHAYTMEEMAKRTLSLDEAKVIEKDTLIPIKPPKSDEIYFGSPTKYESKIKLDRPLFVTPYKSIASIFVWRDWSLQNRIPRGSYNHNYKEWINFNPSKSNNILKEVHVYVEGAPFLEPFTTEQEGFVHCIKKKDYENNFYRYKWMTDDMEYLISDVDEVNISRVIKCKVKYYVEGKPCPTGKFYGPSKGGILQFVHEIANKIHAKYEIDKKEPTGNQNCLLSTWCAEACCRGIEMLPRAIYSPRDSALNIVPGDIIKGVKTVSLKGGYDILIEHLRSVKEKFARWYCHVNWNGGTGGHEFLIVKVDENSFGILDAQQGTFKPLNSTKYFKDINWNNSYICRIDDKTFDFRKFEQINNAKPLAWDEKKDIAFMLREGMITKEESDKVFNKKNVFEIAMSKPVQEGAWNDIRNGVNPFSTKRVFHISPEGHLDGQVFKPRVPEYLDKYDPSYDNFEDVENPRVCFSPSIEGCLNAIMVKIGRWKTAEKLREWYVYIPEKPLKEYKHRTTKQLIKEKKVYDANVTDEIWIEEPVRLKQYGVIRIDQVSSKSVKTTVPTTKGFAGERYKYSFKWHWLVKPKVIADLPYDYSPKEVCEDMIADMEKYKYGLAENGTVHSASAHDYDTKYRLQSPEEFEKNGGGICYDYVEFMEGYLDAYGYDCKKYFISTNTADNDTHTFLLVKDGKGKYIYPESSFKLIEGVYEVKNYEEAALKIMDKVFDINHNGEKYDEIKYYIWEYSGHPPYGSDMKTCMKYFSKGNPIYEGTAKKLKRKD